MEPQAPEDMSIINRFKVKFWSRQFLWCDNAILFYLALTKLIIHLITANGYGYFGDELYWQAMVKHLDFGYVDVPPLTAYLGAISRFLLGASMSAIRLWPALAGALMVYLAGLTARELGGRRLAQWFAAFTVLAAPWLLTLNAIFTYDPFDQLCTLILFYLAIRIINQETPKRWLLFGVAAGLGVMTKLTLLATGGALIVSLFFTARRRSFLTVWPWLALFIAVSICLPYVVWQSVHGWPLLTYWHNYALNPNRPHQQPGQFFMALFLQLNPFLIPVCLLGLIYVLFHGAGKKYRILGFTFLILAIFYTGLMKLESRQIVAACFPLLAAGAVWLEKMITAVNSRARGKSFSWLKWIYIGVICVSTALMAPTALPILPVPVLEKYWSATPDFIKEYDYQPGIIPFRHRFSLGWPEMVKEVAAVYHGLPEADRKKCVIWAGFTCNAAAIDQLGKKYGLPDAISNYLSYQIWEAEQLNSGKIPEVAIMLNDLTEFPAYVYFKDVIPVRSFTTSKYSPFPNSPMTIYLCRKPRADFRQAWNQHANYF